MNTYRVGPQTQHLDHRAMTLDDAQAFFALNSNPQVMRHTGEPMLQSISKAREALENYPDFDTIGYGRWGSYLKTTNTLVGFCGLKYLSDLDCVDVGFRFLPEYWGRGFATQACKASIDFGFDTIGLQRIIALVLPDNPASARVLEKCGMKNTGIIEYDEYSPYLYEVTREDRGGSFTH